MFKLRAVTVITWLKGTIIPAKSNGISLDPRCPQSKWAMVQQSMAFLVSEGIPLRPLDSILSHITISYDTSGNQTVDSSNRPFASMIFLLKSSNLQDISSCFDTGATKAARPQTFPWLTSISRMWCPFLLDLWKVAAGIGDGLSFDALSIIRCNFLRL